jgi:glutathione S-transferase
MSKPLLVIGNKNYSSWSLRPWLALKMAGIDFEELCISLYVDGAREQILRHSPAGKVPILRDGDRLVFDSLAICEYAAELAPGARLWPADAGARAHARSISAEMHSGFTALRGAMQMNVRERGRRLAVPASEAVHADVARITAIFEECRARHAAAGPFLFGAFTIADAMFAPVVTRFATYSVALPVASQAYADAVLDLAPMREWVRDGAAETERIDSAEACLAPR